VITAAVGENSHTHKKRLPFSEQTFLAGIARHQELFGSIALSWRNLKKLYPSIKVSNV
jgi:hypothetical protein